MQSLTWPRGRIAAGKQPSFRLKCSIDCAYTARVASTKGKTVLTFSGRLVGKQLTRVPVRAKLRPGRYRLQLSLVAPLNPGRPVNVRSPVFYTTKAQKKTPS